jgi:hypothetical protein
MPGDPKECREHANACMRIAHTASSPEDKEHFVSLANTWRRIAADLESTQGLLGVLNAYDSESDGTALA